MARRTLNDRIFDLTDSELWSSLKADAGDTHAADLRTAILLGKAGQHDEAAEALTSYHQTSRQHSWQRLRTRAAGAKPIDRATCRRFMREASADSIRQNPNLDVDNRAEKLLAVLHDTVSRGDASQCDYLCDVLEAMFGRQGKLFLLRYPIHGMLGIYDQFHMFWWLYLAAANVGHVRPRSTRCAMKLILAVGRAQRKQCDRYFVHNIFTAGCYGLFFLSRTMAEFAESGEWDPHALKMLDTDWDRSFYPADGGHLERNWGYGLHTIGRHQHIWNFAHETGGMGKIEAHYKRGLMRAYQFYPYTLDANGMSPGFGDEGLGDLNEIIDRALASGLFPKGTGRDLGIDTTKSYLMEGCRVAIMRNGNAKADSYANITYGEFAGWHSHMDLLSMNFRANGELLLEEVPRFGPYEGPMDLLWRCDKAHNQLLVDGFHHDSRPYVGEDVHWYSDEQVDYFSACHRAHREVPSNEHQPYLMSQNLIVRRTMVYVKRGGYVLVMDAVLPDGGSDFNRATSQWWHSPQGFTVLKPGLARTNSRKGCAMAWAYADTLRRMEPGDDYLPSESNVPHHKPVSDRWHSLRVRTWDDEVDRPGALGFITALVPFNGKMPDVSVEPLPLTGRQGYRVEAVRVTSPHGKDVFVLNPERLKGVTYRKQAVTQRAIISLAGKRGTLQIK